MMRPESHPLMNGRQFRDAVEAMGYPRKMGGQIFNAILKVHLGTQDPSERSAGDVAFTEISRGHTRADHFVSLPNLAPYADDITEVRALGIASAAIVAELTAPYRETVAEPPVK